MFFCGGGRGHYRFPCGRNTIVSISILLIVRPPFPFIILKDIGPTTLSTPRWGREIVVADLGFGRGGGGGGGGSGEVCTPHAARRTPHAARRTPHAARRTPHAARRTPHAARAARRTPHAARRTPHAARRTPHAARRTPHAARRTPHARTPHAARRTPHAARRTPHAARPLSTPSSIPPYQNPVTGFDKSYISNHFAQPSNRRTQVSITPQ